VIKGFNAPIQAVCICWYNGIHYTEIILDLKSKIPEDENLLKFRIHRLSNYWFYFHNFLVGWMLPEQIFAIKRTGFGLFIFSGRPANNSHASY
jgi:hypothetical protein